MRQGSDTKTDLEVGAKLLEFGIIKLPTIVCDNCLWYAKATDDVLSNECLNASCYDGSEGFSFGPLGKIDHNDNDILNLAISFLYRFL